jgi:hypothetical protein
LPKGEKKFVASDLVFPEGVRLARLDEIPGPEPDRAQAWSRIQAAAIRSGFKVFESADPRFAFYAEANVDAHNIWTVFSDLCGQLLGQSATLLMSEIDKEPAPIGTSDVSLILQYLEPNNYQLAHDGLLQFGLVHQEGNEVSEVFVAPTKHFRLWFRDAALFRALMKQHGIPEVEALQFIDEYARITTPLSPEKTPFESVHDMILRIEKGLAPAGDV